MLDLSQWLAGPAAAAILGDFGADVIMVELPPTGAAPAGQDRKSPGFPVTNRNKRSVILDVRGPSGREAFLELVRVGDVVVENFRPGTLERWGIGPTVLREINPRLVLLRSSGFGQSGPFSGRAAFNPVGLAFGGMTFLNGWPDRPPIRDGVTAGDYSTALFNVLGVMAALLRRDVDGEGQVVDTAMFEAALRLTGDALAVEERAGRPARASGRRMAAVSEQPHAACRRWPLRDGIRRIVGRLLLRPRTTERPAGSRRRAASATRWRSWSAPSPRSEAVSALRAAPGSPRAPSTASPTSSATTHLWSRGELLRSPHPELGDVVTQGVVPRLSRTPGRVTGWSRQPGSESDAVLGGLLGYTSEQIRQLTDPRATAESGVSGP